MGYIRPQLASHSLVAFKAPPQAANKSQLTPFNFEKTNKAIDNRGICKPQNLHRP